MIAISYYYIYLSFEEHNLNVLNEVDPLPPGPSLWDYVHIILTLTCRSLIIGVKYSLYSDEHFYLIRNHKLSNYLNWFILVGAVILDPDVNTNMKRIEQTMEFLAIDEQGF